VEDLGADARALLEPCLPPAEAAARGLPELRSIRRPARRHAGLITGRTFDSVADRAIRGPEHDRTALLAQLGVEIDPELLTLALTHRSYAYENGGLPTNERLEFLGDSVLGVIVTERLYRSHPDLPEGQLAKLRASVVNMNALASVARTLGEPGTEPAGAADARVVDAAASAVGARPGEAAERGLGRYLYLGRGEELTGGRGKASILADATEALIGAVYLEHGLEVARELVERLFDALLKAAPLLGAGLDWKTSLQELTAAAELGVPEYRISEDGPDHLKTFTAVAVVAGRRLGTGVGRTKKEAEQKAAQLAWRALSADAGGAAERAGS
jgi:ribonuclease-3